MIRFFRSCFCRWLEWCDQTGEIRSPAIFLSCIDVVPLQSPVSQSPVFTSSRITTNSLRTFFSFTQWQRWPHVLLFYFTLWTLLRASACTRWEVWMFAPRRDVLAPPCASSFSISFHFPWFWSSFDAATLRSACASCFPCYSQLWVSLWSLIEHKLRWAICETMASFYMRLTNCLIQALRSD